MATTAIDGSQDPARREPDEAAPRSRSLLPSRAVVAVSWLVAAALLAIGAALVAGLVSELAAAPTVGAHHDFLAFWGAGRLIIEGRPDLLYDSAAMTAVQRTVIPYPVGANGYMPFINPPFVAVAMASLGSLSEPAARVLWAGASVVLAIAVAAWLGRSLGRFERIVVGALVVSSVPTIHALAEGQLSILLLGAAVAAIAAARRGSWGWAGVALGVLSMKPQLVVLPLVALILARRWRAVGGTVATPVAATIATLPVTGMTPYATYVGYLLSVTTSHFSGAGAAGAAVWRGDLASTEGINGLLANLLGQGDVGPIDVGWLALSLLLVGLVALAMRRRPPGFDRPGDRLMLAAGIALVLLVNPNLFIQDCVLVFAVVEAVRPLPSGWRFAVAVGVAALAGVLLLDEQATRFHAFTILLFAGVVAVSLRTLLRREASEREASGLVRDA